MKPSERKKRISNIKNLITNHYVSDTLLKRTNLTSLIKNHIETSNPKYIIDSFENEGIIKRLKRGWYIIKPTGDEPESCLMGDIESKLPENLIQRFLKNDYLICSPKLGFREKSYFSIGENYYLALDLRKIPLKKIPRDIWQGWGFRSTEELEKKLKSDALSLVNNNNGMVHLVHFKLLDDEIDKEMDLKYCFNKHFLNKLT